MPDGRLAVVFPYSDEIVGKIRHLSERKWNAQSRQWEVGIVHLPELMEILRLDQAQVDRKVLRAYQVFRIRHGRAKVMAGNVEAVLSGGNLPLEKIDRQTSYHLPGYKYMTRFKKGTWDGRRHLFHVSTQKFPSGLVPRVCKIITAAGIECDVVWPEEPPPRRLAPDDGPAADAEAPVAKPASRRKKSAVEPVAPPKANLTKLRDYQAACLKKALSHKRGIIEIATGGGKTLLAAHLIHTISRPAIFLVHTRDLLYQTIEVLERELGYGVGCVGDGKILIRPVTVATVQTCARAMDIKIDTCPDGINLGKDKPPGPDGAEALRQFIRSVAVAIFDECHHLPTDTTYGLSSEMHNAHWRYGLSATPYRADGQDMLMEAALGARIYRARASDLIDKGYLVAPRIKFMAVPPLNVRSGRLEYSEVYSDYIVENRRRNTLIVKQARHHATDGKTVLILVTQVRHGEVLRDLLGKAPLLQGSNSMEERKKILSGLESGKHPIVIATPLADEGINIPSLNCVIVASGGRSETRVLQRIGRALRPAKGKDSAVIIDFLDDAPYLRDHASDRLELYKTESRFILES